MSQIKEIFMEAYSDNNLIINDIYQIFLFLYKCLTIFLYVKTLSYLISVLIFLFILLQMSFFLY